jgi:GntR family transcriptional regulator
MSWPAGCRVVTDIGTGDPVRQLKKTGKVAAELRARILSGEWADGYVVPSQEELVEKYDVSVVTVRNAIDVLVGEGLIDKSQGRQSRVTYRDPSHRLVVRLHQASTADRVAEPPISFTQDPEAGTPVRRCAERVLRMPREYGRLLGLREGVEVVERAILLSIDREPVLVSMSYLPVELADDGQWWRGAEVGQLALHGYVVTAEYVDERSRMPRPEEAAQLSLRKGVPLKILSHPCWVVSGERRVLAGVIVLARGDRVFLRWARTMPMPRI